MIRPILDGVLVRMDPPREMTAGGLHIPSQAQALTGTWTAQRDAKIGTVLAVGPGRARRKRTSHERAKARAAEPLTPEDISLMWDSGSAGSLEPVLVKVGDRVLFDPVAELRPTSDPQCWVGAAYQVAAVLEPEDVRPSHVRAIGVGARRAV